MSIFKNIQKLSPLHKSFAALTVTAVGIFTFQTTRQALNTIATTKHINEIDAVVIHSIKKIRMQVLEGTMLSTTFPIIPCHAVSDEFTITQVHESVKENIHCFAKWRCVSSNNNKLLSCSSMYNDFERYEFTSQYKDGGSDYLPEVIMTLSKNKK